MRTGRASRRSRDWASGRQGAYAAKGAADLDPELAKALGYDGGDPSKPVIGEAPENADEISKFPSRGARRGSAHHRSR